MSIVVQAVGSIAFVLASIAILVAETLHLVGWL